MASPPTWPKLATFLSTKTTGSTATKSRPASRCQDPTARNWGATRLLREHGHGRRPSRQRSSARPGHAPRSSALTTSASAADTARDLAAAGADLAGRQLAYRQPSAGATWVRML